MADTKPSDAFNDELLSAYVDGELKGDELAQVERRLQTDPQAKQLVEELRALSSTIQSLPRETVGEDLREAVLRRAEHSASIPLNRSKGGVRRWGWAVMALAAALMLMIFQPGAEQDAQPVASVDTSREQAEQPVPQLQALAAVPVAGEALVEKKSEVAKSKLAGTSLAVDELGSSFDDNTPRSIAPVQIVHVAVNNGTEEFEKLLISNRVVRVTVPSSRVDSRSRSKSEAGVLGRQLKPAAEPLNESSEASQAEEVLVEGTVEQIEQLVLACQNDKDRYSSVRVEDIRRRGVNLGALQSTPAEAANSKGDVALEQAATNESAFAESADEQVEEEGVEATVAGVIERIRVLFVLYTDPQVEKTVPAKKKALSGEKVGGKAG